MKIIDRNGRLFGKISVIDLLVIAVVLVMAAALYVKNTRLNVQEERPSQQPQQDITFQIRVNGARNYLYQAIRVDDELWERDNPDSPDPLGVITEVRVINDPGTVLTAMDDGTAEMIPAEDSVDLLITVESSGVVSDRSYLINGVYSVGINSNRNYYTPAAQFTGIVVDVR